MKKKLDLGWVRTYDKREYAAVLESNTFFFFLNVLIIGHCTCSFTSSLVTLKKHRKNYLISNHIITCSVFPILIKFFSLSIFIDL